MRSERLVEFLGAVQGLVSVQSNHLVGPMRTSVTTDFPNVIPTTPFRGFSIAEVLSPPLVISRREASMLYEQVVWLKYQNDLDAEAKHQLKQELIAKLGAPMANCILKEKVKERAVLLLVWSFGRSWSMEITLSERDGFIKLHDSVFGYVDGKLVSQYLSGTESGLSLEPLLTKPMRVTVRNSAAFCVLNALTKRDPELNGFLKVAFLYLGARQLHDLYQAKFKLTGGAGGKLGAKLYKEAMSIVEDETMNPVPRLLFLLVPAVLSKPSFKQMFGSVTNNRVVGVRKRSNIKKTLESLFL